MNKILEFGKKAMFYVRVLSGYEVRKIRSYRLELNQRIQQAHQKKAALNKVPEQIIISEVRKMVEDMQALNKRLDEAEAQIEDYFKPIDKEAEIIMQGQLESEEQRTKHMIETFQTQALHEKEEAERLANSQKANADQQPECADKTALTGAPPKTISAPSWSFPFLEGLVGNFLKAFGNFFLSNIDCGVTKSNTMV